MEGNLENNTDWNCYIVNINSVQENNNGNYLEMYLKFCNHQEIEKIMSFVFPKDQIRALISIFLQRYIIMKKYQIISPSIQRTRENKPYLPYTRSHQQEYWNYNVSHHGDYVGIVSHNYLLIGTDIVDTNTRPPWVSNFNEFLDIYRKQLAPEEITTLLGFQDTESQYLHFYLIWALKEAYVKAIGVGIGIDLTQIRFVLSDMDGVNRQSRGTATMFINQIKREDWRFEYFPLDDTHMMSIAYGPSSEALVEYQTMAWGSCSQESSVSHMEHLNQLSPVIPKQLEFSDLFSELKNFHQTNSNS